MQMTRSLTLKISRQQAQPVLSKYMKSERKREKKREGEGQREGTGRHDDWKPRVENITSAGALHSGQ